MTAYWINTFTAIRDADKLAAYAQLSGPAILAAGGEFLARRVPAPSSKAVSRRGAHWSGSRAWRRRWRPTTAPR